MAITTLDSLATFNARVAYESFINGAMTDPSLINFMSFVKVGTTTAKTLKTTGMSGVSGYSPRVGLNPGVAITTESLIEDSPITYTQTVYEAGLAVSRDALYYLDSAIESPASAVPRDLGQIAMQTFQDLAVALVESILTVTGPDGVTYANDSHPTGVTTWDNLITSALDYDAVAAANNLLALQRNRAGAMVSTRAKKLLVPVALERRALQITTAQSETAALQPNVVNLIMPGLQVVPLVGMADANDYFLLSDVAKLRMLFAVGPAPRVYRDSGTQNLIIDDHFHVATGIDSPLGIVAAQVA